MRGNSQGADAAVTTGCEVRAADADLGFQMVVSCDALYPVTLAIDDLRPTQMTLGYEVVRRKRQKWRDRTDRARAQFLDSHPVPVVVGPDKQWWMVDRHHLVRVLHEEGVVDVPIELVADLSGIRSASFAQPIESRSWLRPLDAEGRRQPLAAMPQHIRDLDDDPYRSLASELRRMGGYAKDRAPYSEFQWADFLRERIDPATVRFRFHNALAEALRLAQGSTTQHLPGWRGVGSRAAPGSRSAAAR